MILHCKIFRMKDIALQDIASKVYHNGSYRRDILPVDLLQIIVNNFYIDIIL